jgi:hypothetical protein
MFDFLKPKRKEEKRPEPELKYVENKTYNNPPAQYNNHSNYEPQQTSYVAQPRGDSMYTAPAPQKPTSNPVPPFQLLEDPLLGSSTYSLGSERTMDPRSTRSSSSSLLDDVLEGLKGMSTESSTPLQQQGSTNGASLFSEMKRKPWSSSL